MLPLQCVVQGELVQWQHAVDDAHHLLLPAFVRVVAYVEELVHRVGADQVCLVAQHQVQHLLYMRVPLQWLTLNQHVGARVKQVLPFLQDVRNAVCCCLGVPKWTCGKRDAVVLKHSSVHTLCTDQRHCFTYACKHKCQVGDADVNTGNKHLCAITEINMSTTHRYREMNLLVETFLRERNLEHLLPEWRDEAVQQQVLQHIACLCVPTRGITGRDPTLTMTCGAEVMRLPPSKELVFLGKQCRAMSHPRAVTMDHVFVDDAWVHDLHCLIKQVTSGHYLLSTFAPTYTWVQIESTGNVLLPGAALLVGTHILQVLQAPLVRERHRALPTVSTVVPLPLVANEVSEVEIKDGEQTPCILECIAPPSSTLYKKKWLIPYDRGNSVLAIGTGKTNAVVLPATDTRASVQHCYIRSCMGYYWILPVDDALVYHQLYPSSRSLAILAVTPPIRLLLGEATHLTLAIS